MVVQKTPKKHTTADTWSRRAARVSVTDCERSELSGTSPSTAVPRESRSDEFGTAAKHCAEVWAQ